MNTQMNLMLLYYGEDNIKYANKIMLDFHDNSNLIQDDFDKVDAIMLKSNIIKDISKI